MTKILIICAANQNIQDAVSQVFYRIRNYDTTLVANAGKHFEVAIIQTVEDLKAFEFTDKTRLFIYNNGGNTLTRSVIGLLSSALEQMEKAGATKGEAVII